MNCRMTHFRIRWKKKRWRVKVCYDDIAGIGEVKFDAAVHYTDCQEMDRVTNQNTGIKHGGEVSDLSGPFNAITW